MKSWCHRLNQIHEEQHLGFDLGRQADVEKYGPTWSAQGVPVLTADEMHAKHRRVFGY